LCVNIRQIYQIISSVLLCKLKIDKKGYLKVMQTAYPYICIHSLLLGKNKGKKVCNEVYLLLVMTNTTVKNISARDNSTVVPTSVAVVPDIVSVILAI